MPHLRSARTIANVAISLGRPAGLATLVFLLVDGDEQMCQLHVVDACNDLAVAHCVLREVDCVCAILIVVNRASRCCIASSSSTDVRAAAVDLIAVLIDCLEDDLNGRSNEELLCRHYQVRFGAIWCAAPHGECDRGIGDRHPIQPNVHGILALNLRSVRHLIRTNPRVHSTHVEVHFVREGTFKAGSKRALRGGCRIAKLISELRMQCDFLASRRRPICFLLFTQGSGALNEAAGSMRLALLDSEVEW